MSNLSTIYVEKLNQKLSLDKNNPNLHYSIDFKL